MVTSDVRFGTIYRVKAPAESLAKKAAEAYAMGLNQFGTSAKALELRFSPEVSGHYVLTEEDLTDYLDIQNRLNSLSLDAVDLAITQEYGDPENSDESDDILDFQAQHHEEQFDEATQDLMAFFFRVETQSKVHCVDAQGKRLNVKV